MNSKEVSWATFFGKVPHIDLEEGIEWDGLHVGHSQGL